MQLAIVLDIQPNQCLAHLSINGKPVGQPIQGASPGDCLDQIKAQVAGNQPQPGPGGPQGQPQPGPGGPQGQPNADGDQGGSQIAHGEAQPAAEAIPTMEQMFAQEAEARMRKRQVVMDMS